MSWTDERLERAITLWNKGWSAGEIERSIGGVSRSAVIGKLTRLFKSGDTRITRPLGQRMADGTSRALNQQRERDQISLYILQRRELDNASFTEIGAELGKSAAAVSTQYSAITRDLQQSEVA